jgi:hypothetical protein
LTKFSQNVIKCIAGWGKKSAECNGSIQCLEGCARDLRNCLDMAFPDSKKIEFESDKVNYILSSVFFLANRICKASIGLAELDRIIDDTKDIGYVSLENKENRKTYEKMKQQLDEMIARFF